MEERLQSKYRGPLNIVLADDDSDDRDLFEEAASFVAPDVSIKFARDGEELMEQLAKGDSQKPDLLFLDLNMPKKNGKQCLREMQSTSRLKSIPVIIYTTSLNQLDIKETYESGARHFFRKPNSFEELKEILQKALTSDLSQARKFESYVLTAETKLLVK